MTLIITTLVITIVAGFMYDRLVIIDTPKGDIAAAVAGAVMIISAIACIVGVWELF